MFQVVNETCGYSLWKIRNCRLRSFWRSTRTSAPYESGCQYLLTSATLETSWQRSAVTTRWWTSLTAWQYWTSSCLSQWRWRRGTCGASIISPTLASSATTRSWRCTSSTSTPASSGQTSTLRSRPRSSSRPGATMKWTQVSWRRSSLSCCQSRTRWSSMSSSLIGRCP